jgi:hypothetical protein
MRMSRECSLPHGASGAPLIRLDTGEVIAVFGTASDANAAPCELNNPCEVASDGTKRPATASQGYAHFVHKLYTCLDGARDIDVNVAGCLLPRPQR